MGRLLEVRDLKKYFPVRGGWVRAVDGVSLDLREGEILALVGESGSGKTTTALVILRLIPPTAGEVYLEGIPLFRVSGKELRRLRRRVQPVFQDPYASLHPHWTVRKIVAEGLRAAGGPGEGDESDRVAGLLRRVGLSPDLMDRRPAELSGGQCQRVAIARALAVRPRLLVADEPVSLLDVSVQARVLHLFLRLKEEVGLSVFLITHDFRVVEAIADRVAVMYLGRIVETAETKRLLSRPLHPYTQALLSAVPVPDPETRRPRLLLPGEPPSPIRPPGGCRFHPRCPYVMERCARIEPELREVEPGHSVACHLYGDVPNVGTTSDGDGRGRNLP